MDTDLKRRIDRWVGNVGIKNAEVYLIKEGISSSTAQKLTRGKYPSKPNQLMTEAIESALKKGA